MCFVEEGLSSEREDQPRRKDNLLYFAKTFPEFFQGFTIEEVGQREIKRCYADIWNRNPSRDDMAQGENDRLIHGWLEAFGMR